MILRKKERKQWRIYDHEKQQYIYGATLIGSDGKVYTQEFHPNHKIVTYENTTIEQNTFIKDKNGRFIYENDIIKFEVGDKEYFRQVVNKHDYGCFMLTKKGETPYSFLEMYQMSVKEFEVVGNIHQDLNEPQPSSY